MITFNKTAKWCLDFTDEYMSEHLDGDYHISTVTLPTERTPGATMVFIDAFEPDMATKASGIDDIVKSIGDIDILLTRRPELLTAFPDKAQKMIYGTTWIKDVKSDKEQSISFAMTNKLDPAQKADGYKLRHAFLKTVMNNRPDFSVPFKFFDSTRSPCFESQVYGSSPFDQREWAMNSGTVSYHYLRDDKEPVFDSMFSVIIENQRLPNYITEKLIDCIVSKTLPLYYGCPNVNDYFDTDGMIIIQDQEHLIDVVENLTVEDYEKRLPAMQKNLELAQDLARPLADRTIEAIKKAN